MKNVPALFLILLVLAGSVSAQCVLDPIQSQTVEGYLVFGFQEKYRIVEKAEVRILDHHNTQQVIAMAEVNKNGYFRIKGVKPGNYILSGRSEALAPAFVDIKVIREKPYSDASQKEPLILIVLGADTTKECAGASITVRPKSSIEKMIRSAVGRSPTDK